MPTIYVLSKPMKKVKRFRLSLYVAWARFRNVSQVNQRMWAMILSFRHSWSLYVEVYNWQFQLIIILLEVILILKE